MTAFGQATWLAAGRALLTEPIQAEAYMSLLVKRQDVYLDANPGHACLLEWFCWPEDNDFVILPDRTTAEPRPTRPAPTREALVAKRDALQSQLGRLTAKLDRAGPTRRHDTDDMAAYGGIGIRQTARQHAKFAVAFDRAMAGHARLTQRVSRVRAALAHVDAQIARAA